MCGIAGLLTDTDKDPLPHVRMMAEAMAHRGPDGEGFQALSAGGFRGVFGHRRLAVIDCSPAGKQPLTIPEGLVITYNGEVTNYRDVRNELIGLGHRFASDTDTEVVLRSYLQWGLNHLSRLEGMFAFALWDPRDGSVILARDRLGIKPLYVWESNGSLAFASEVRGLLASGLVPKELNLDCIAGYLETGAVRSPATAIARVRSLSPGTQLIWREGKSSEKPYWALEDHLGKWRDRPGSLEDLRAVLGPAIRREMVSDVPIGVFLSGGIDSGAIVSSVSGRNAHVKTVSLAFDDADLDERKHQSALAELYKTEHSVVVISHRHAEELLPRFGHLQDQPCVDGPNVYLVSEAARQAGLTVALSGLGGDEIFGGYGSFNLARAWAKYGKGLTRTPRPVRALVGAGLRSRGKAKAAELVVGAASAVDIHRVTRRLFPVEPSNSPSALEGFHPLDQMTYLETTGYMRDTTLRQADGMSMRHSLEVRVPLLNHRIVEAALAMPPDKRFQTGTPKWALVHALESPLPNAIVHRRKGTFTLPFASWLRTNAKDLGHELLLSTRSRQRGIFDPDVVERTWNGFQQGKPGCGWAQVWALCAFESWCRANLDGGS